MGFLYAKILLRMLCTEFHPFDESIQSIGGDPPGG